MTTEKNAVGGTLGQHRVRVDFNPSNNVPVYQIKTDTADLIDRMELLKSQSEYGEVKRCAALAQTAYEEAAMWAVKALTFEG